MNQETGLLSAAWRTVRQNKRYIVWFWLLNLVLGYFGARAFRDQASAVLDHSVYADQLLHRFNPTVLVELLASPQTGSIHSVFAPGLLLAVLFAVATFVLIPGVLRQYTSHYRVSGEEFFRTCGRNLWRFIRLEILYGVIALPLAGILFGIRGGLQTAAEKSTNEVLPFTVGLIALAVIFLVMTAVRIWFDLAQVDLVVRDQNSALKAAGTGFRYTRRNLARLLSAYTLIALLSLLVLAVGLWLWNVTVPPSSVTGAFLIGQAMLVLWLVGRFWQRSVTAEFFMREVLVLPHYQGSAVATAGTAPAAPLAAAPSGTSPA